MIILGDCLIEMAHMAPDSVDSIVTDPPYGLSFMGRDWDRGVPGAPFWHAALRVATPGAFMVAFGGSRTHHRLACAIEDAGWELRDCLMWLYGQGFPKSNGALKPGWEPILLARKRAPGPKLQIDACRIDPRDGKGRWPANVILDEDAARLLDEQSGILTSGFSAGFSGEHRAEIFGRYANNKIRPETIYADTGGASRFFYCAKASRSERTHGGVVENKHPTVKPIALMRWLVRLITPPAGRVLDPFCGSGSSGIACALEGMSFVGIDLDEASVATARERIRLQIEEEDYAP